jgi:hypothetical protein
MAASRGLISLARWLAGLLSFFALLLLPLTGGRAQDYDVDLALVLAVDSSFSVDSREYELQMQGLGRAFLQKEVQLAIAQGVRQRIAVAVVQWSDANSQSLALPWTVISNDADAEALGRRLMGLPRQLAEGGTSISAALSFSASLFAMAPAAERRVIDVSSDGRNNSGPPVAPVRARIVAEGITINALTILTEWKTLDIYFERNVAGGPDHFVIPADDYEAYGEAMLMKLLREITGPGIT